MAAAQAMYQPEVGPPKAPGAWDMSLIAAAQVVQVWPENWPAFEAFARLQTQWRIGMSGPTGLDYAAAYPLLDRMTDDDTEWLQLLDDLRTMERAALEQLRENAA